MAKKTFSTSPLMTFITPPAPETPEEAPAKAAEGQEPADTITQTPPEAKAASEGLKTQNAEGGAVAPEAPKPPRKDNFLTTAEERAGIAARNARYKSTPPTPPEYRAAMDIEEPRSRRVQLLVKPSIYKRIRDIAHWQRQSVNNLFEEILTAYLEGRDEKGRRQ